MQISSATRAFSSAVLVTAFLFAPMGNLLQVHATLARVPVAEASAPLTNNISGTVRIFTSATSTSDVAPGVPVSLYLKKSGALQAKVVTDATGMFVFAAPEGVDYVVSLEPVAGYGILAGTHATFELTNFTGTIILDGFVIEKLPELVLNGSSTVAVKLNGTYQELGAVLRRLDGTAMTDYQVEATGVVNTKVAGEYTVKYHVTPRATSGFPTADVSRKVIVGTPVNVAVLAPALSAVAPVASCKLLNIYMSKDATNDKLEVLKLQTFLFIYEGLMNVRATGVYDEATERGVRIFQDRHFPEVLSLWGVDGNTGNVYMTTQKKINEVYCGHEFPLAFSQLKEIAAYRVAALGARGAGLAKTEVSSVAATNDVKQGGLAAWWNRAKSSLLAVMPSFGKKESSVNTITASGSVAAKSVEDNPVVKNKTGNIATAFYNFRNFLNMTAIAALFALLLGVFAFGVSVYLYRRTRGEEEEAEVVGASVVDIPSVPKKVK